VSTRAPFTRTLPYVLRDQLARPEVRLIAAKVTAIPDPGHVTIDLGGATTIIPRLKSYAPAIGEPAQVLALGSVMLALGTVAP